MVECVSSVQVSPTPAAKHGHALVLHWLRLQVQPAHRFLHSPEQPQNFSHICKHIVILWSAHQTVDQTLRSNAPYPSSRMHIRSQLCMANQDDDTARTLEAHSLPTRVVSYRLHLARGACAACCHVTATKVSINLIYPRSQSETEK